MTPLFPSPNVSTGRGLSVPKRCFFRSTKESFQCFLSTQKIRKCQALGRNSSLGEIKTEEPRCPAEEVSPPTPPPSILIQFQPEVHSGHGVQLRNVF